MPDYGLFYTVATGVLTAIVIAIAGYFNLRIKKDELQNYKKEESNAAQQLAFREMEFKCFAICVIITSFKRLYNLDVLFLPHVQIPSINLSFFCRSETT